MGRSIVHHRLGPCAAALSLLNACSLMIEFEELPESEPSEITVQNVPDEDAGLTSRADADPDFGVAPDRDAGDGGGTYMPPPPARAARSYVAFIEDRDEDQARLRIVDVAEALAGTSAGEPPWRRTLIPAAQSGDALDFAWSPDGQRLVLRYESLSGTRLAYFAAPGWQELPLDELDLPASQAVLAATARYTWSPDGTTLAAELTSAEGVFLAGHALAGDGVRALLPVEYSTGLESMAWFSERVLLTIQASPDAREVIALTLVDGELGQQRVLPSDTLLSPLELRRAPEGVIAATRLPESWFYFWSAESEPDVELGFTGYAFISGGDRFVAETDDIAATASLERLGGSDGVLDTLPECSSVLSWGEGPGADLTGSKVACLHVLDGVAALRVYAYPNGAPRSSQALTGQALSLDFADPGRYQAFARAFSPDNGWLVLSSLGRDVLYDLRGAEPAVLELPSALPGTTAHAFAPSGRYLISQRGTQLRLIVLPGAPAGFPVLTPLPLPEAAREASACSVAPHADDWCGAPDAARGASARWSSAGDVALLLTRDEGLAALTPGAQGFTLLRTTLSTCGAACVRQYAFNL